jgi:hypothetical protein
MIEAPLTVGRGNIVEMGRSSLSILGKTAIPVGAWVRIESNGWILFGVVRDRISTSMKGGYLQIHLQAAFPADINYETSAAKIISVAQQPTRAILDDMIEEEGASL